MKHTPDHASPAFIALGSNLGDSLAHVRRAIDELAALPDTQLIKHSKLHQSVPLGGPAQQNHYVNAAVLLHTRLNPESLLDQLQTLEQAHGRIRTERWGPRTLDLDIILYDQLCYQTPRLTLPHKSLFERDFVLRPLADINPELVFPDGTQLAERLAALTGQGTVLSEIL